MTKFIAFAIDINETALARYDLAATEADAAEREARQYLEDYPAIEIAIDWLDAAKLGDFDGLLGRQRSFRRRRGQGEVSLRRGQAGGAGRGIGHI